MLIMFAQLATFLSLFALVLSLPVNRRTGVVVAWCFCAHTLAFTLGGFVAMWSVAGVFLLLVIALKAFPFLIERVTLR